MNLFLLRMAAVLIVAPFSWDRAIRMRDKLVQDIHDWRMRFRARHPEVPWDE